MLKTRDACWGHEHRGRREQHHGPWGSSESGITNQKAGAGGKENNPGTNQRELRRETGGDGEELFRAAARGQRPHTVDTSVPLPLWNKAQDSCPGACPPSATGSSPSQQPGCAQGQQLQPLVQSYLVLGRKGLEVAEDPPQPCLACWDGQAQTPRSSRMEDVLALLRRERGRNPEGWVGPTLVAGSGSSLGFPK